MTRKVESRLVLSPILSCDDERVLSVLPRKHATDVKLPLQIATVDASVWAGSGPSVTGWSPPEARQIPRIQ